MNWKPNGPYALKSGDYFITKNSTSEGWVYLCFHMKELIGRAKDSQEAREICERHRFPTK